MTKPLQIVSLFPQCFFHFPMCLHKFVKLVTRESARFGNNDSGSKSQVRLLKFPEENYKFFRDILSKTFCRSANVRMFFVKRHLLNRKWTNTKINRSTTGGLSNQIWPFRRVKTMLCIPCKSATDPASTVRGTISITFGRQVSLRVH